MAPEHEKASSRMLPLLALGNVLAGMLLIPAARPLLAERFPGSDGALHAFFSVNMFGAVLGAPLVSWLADRRGSRRAMAVGLSLLDGVLLLACLLPLPLWAVLALRTVQGAAGVGALSVVMGSARSPGPAAHGGAMGRMAAAVVAGIALGAPLGTLLLTGGPELVFVSAAALAGLGALGCLTLAQGTRSEARSPVRAVARALKVPALFVGAERFAVGCFVTTFSLYAHQALGQSDREVGVGFSVFLLCFALSSWTVGLASGRLSPALLLSFGATSFGLGFASLGFVGEHGLWPLLASMGLASGCIYTPSLCLASQAVPQTQRSTAMGLLNGAGTLGMMLGTALAGALSATLMHRGWARAEATSAVFVLAGGAQWLVLAVAGPALLRAARAPDTGPAGIKPPAHGLPARWR
ncbi:MAG: MFS transporter [Archangium sp.]|nr:MFS transporter [Archangium sp.]